MHDAARVTVVHLGAHKTASTHLQQALKRAVPSLREAGARVFLPDDLRRHGLRLQDWLGQGDPDPAHEGILRAAFGAAAARLVISEENILGMVPAAELALSPLLYPKAGARLARLASLLPKGPPPVLALAVRSPAGFLVSCHAQALMAGRVRGFDAMFGGLDPAALSWDDLAGRLLAALPGARLTVWDHADWPAVAPRAARALLGEGAGPLALPPGLSHPGLSAEAVSRLLARAPAEPAAARDMAKELRARFGKEAGYPPFDPWPAGMRERAAAAHVRDMARLAARPGVTFLRAAPG